MKTTFDRADAIKLRELYLKRANEICEGAALALSGGTDSLTVLFAMLDAGMKPRCYTFYMDGIISADLQSARYICKQFGLELIEVPIRSDVDSCYDDAMKVIPYCEHCKKTIIQCMIPFSYVYPAMKETRIISGIGGDDIFCTQRKLQVEFHKSGDEAIMKYRKVYSDDLKFSAANIIRYAANFRKEHIDFYNTESIVSFFREYSLAALNKPVMKYASVAAYPEYYASGSYYRDQTEHSFQVNSKLRECQDKLLSSKHNKGQHKAIIGLYNQMWKEVRGND